VQFDLNFPRAASPHCLPSPIVRWNEISHRCACSSYGWPDSSPTQ